MTVTETAIVGAYTIAPRAVEDERGFFAKTWAADEFRARGLNADFVECNDSYCRRAGTLRGLHLQTAPHGEVKLVRCVRGAIFDVVVDLRPESSTFCQWFGATLTPDDRTMVYVPEGCAHGYLSLEDESEVIYFSSARYHPDAERGIRWDDRRFGIAWPSPGPVIVSQKDRTWPDFHSAGVAR